MDQLSLKNKVAVVTGSTSGIGRATALCFASLGATVYINGRNETKVRELVNELKNQDFDIDGYAGDVSDLSLIHI